MRNVRCPLDGFVATKEAAQKTPNSMVLSESMKEQIFSMIKENIPTGFDS
jgi:RNA-splicing ligase RtcB